MTDDASTAALADPDLQDAAWDLDPLVENDGEAGVERQLAEAAERAQSFADRYEGKVREFDAATLAEAMTELAGISELVGRAGTYASLRFSTDTADPERGALMQKVSERATDLQTKLLFFELEWAALCDEHAEALLADERLDFCRHHLRSERRYRPHLLSEPEEKILTETSITGSEAWCRLFAELTSAIAVDMPGRDGEEAPQKVALDVALSNLFSPERQIRRATAEAVTAALEPGLRTRGFIFNTLLHDKAVNDRLRSYPSWLASRNLSNEATDESVQALLEAVRKRYEIPRRWYRLKAELLGVDKLTDYDRMAAVTAEDASVGYGEARELVVDCYSSFSEELGGLVRRFFDEKWIDAPVRPGKRGGAFCASAVPSAHPYVMLNWTSRRRDVLTLAHELGHGVHFALAREQGIFHQGTGLTLAETASVFGEEVTFARLLEQAKTPQSRLSLLAESIEDTIATVFRQTAMNRFEDLVHTSRREEGELSVERFGDLWEESQTEMLGDSVEITQGYRSWWSYVPHFVNTPGYVYAYAFGQLLALSVYQRYRDEGPSFVPAYLEMLAAGGSKPPEELGKIVGVDLTDPGFWDQGLDLVERQLEAAEAAAREV
ncbi:MAG: M3 family oligoendopeptidase [Thermoleophilaceae bacterium]|nr:M3 family oligoendopeptidase [Thermoleophilaceae bacterium]